MSTRILKWRCITGVNRVNVLCGIQHFFKEIKDNSSAQNNKNTHLEKGIWNSDANVI